MALRIASLLLALGLALPDPLSGRDVTPSPHGIRLHVGMWTTHLNRPRRGLDANWLVALGWRGMYGGTFINSFGDRAFAAGIERPVVRRDEGSLARGLGYRLGVVTGYDERLISLAGKTPLLPAFQVIGDLGVGRTGVEFAWAGKVATMSPFMRVAN